MSKNYNENIIQSVKDFNLLNNRYNCQDLSVTSDGYIYSFGHGYNNSSYLIYKKNCVIIKGPEKIIDSVIVDSNEVIYFYEKEKKIYIFESFKSYGKKGNFFCFYSHEVKKMRFSKNGKFAVTIDIFGMLNLYCMKTFKIMETIHIKYSKSIDEIYVSPDGKTILITKNNKLVILKNKKIKTIPLIYKQIDRYYFGFIEVYFGEDDIIKLGFSNANVVVIKDGKIIKIIIRNFMCRSRYFSPCGKMIFILDDEDQETVFIHEDSDEYSNKFSFVNGWSYTGVFSPDGKLFISRGTKSANFVIHDISFIGYKKCQKLQFLSGLIDKSSNVNSFFENDLFDINLVKLIFDFLPFSKEMKK